MRRTFVGRLQLSLIICLSLNLPAHGSARQGQAQRTASAAGAITSVLFNASDANDLFVTSLRQEDVRVLEDGVPQTLLTFSRELDAPLSLVIAIDNSYSQARLLPATRKAAQALLGLLRSPEDRAAVISFSGEVVLEQDFTGNQARLHQVIESIGWLPLSDTGNGSTSFRDALWLIGQEVFARTSAPASTQARRVLVLLTDGADTSSETKMREATESILKTRATVYAIVAGDPGFDGIKKGAMRSLTERTGGRAYFPRKVEDLRQAIEQIQSALRARYLISYATPFNKGGAHALRKLKIEIVNPELRKQNLRLDYPQGYFAF
jgi:Ca-activated chloride channel family protein